MKSVSVLLIAGAAVMLVGCAGDEGKIKKTVNGFFESVSSGDLDSVMTYFPEFGKLDNAGREAYLTGFAGFSRWEIKSTVIDGSGAVASVEVLFKGAKLTIQLPLASLNGQWVVTERTSVRTKIDVVPAE